MNKSKQGSITMNKLAIVTIVSIGLIGAVSFVGDPPQESLNKSIDVVNKAEEAPKTVTAEKPVEATEAPKVDEVVNQPTFAVARVVEPPVQPQVLSTQEYAKMYLDMSDPRSAVCLSRFAAMFPERFTESVREENVKSLGMYATPCSTGFGVDYESAMRFYDAGIMDMVAVKRQIGILKSHGMNAEFFDKF